MQQGKETTSALRFERLNIVLDFALCGSAFCEYRTATFGPLGQQDVSCAQLSHYADPEQGQLEA